MAKTVSARRTVGRINKSRREKEQELKSRVRKTLKFDQDSDGSPQSTSGSSSLSLDEDQPHEDAASLGDVANNNNSVLQKLASQVENLSGIILIRARECPGCPFQATNDQLLEDHLIQRHQGSKSKKSCNKVAELEPEPEAESDSRHKSESRRGRVVRGAADVRASPKGGRRKQLPQEGEGNEEESDPGNGESSERFLELPPECSGSSPTEGEVNETEDPALIPGLEDSTLARSTPIRLNSGKSVNKVTELIGVIVLIGYGCSRRCGFEATECECLETHEAEVHRDRESPELRNPAKRRKLENGWVAMDDSPSRKTPQKSGHNEHDEPETSLNSISNHQGLNTTPNKDDFQLEPTLDQDLVEASAVAEDSNLSSDQSREDSSPRSDQGVQDQSPGDLADPVGEVNPWDED